MRSFLLASVVMVVLASQAHAGICGAHAARRAARLARRAGCAQTVAVGHQASYTVSYYESGPVPVTGPVASPQATPLAPAKILPNPQAPGKN